MSEDRHEELLRFWIAQGFKFRKRTSKEMQADPKKYAARVRHEFEVIRSVPGYVDYFLMVSDLVRWAKDHGILVGPGRGSAAGSLCCWLLRITEMDPLMYPMLFERFLDPTRTDPPDIDIDFEDERRWEVVQYAQEKYGYDRVANILNFVRYKGANSLKDVGTVYRIPPDTVDFVKDKLIERADGHPRFSETIIDTIEENEDVAALVRNVPELLQATRLEGNYRHTSFHPAALVIAGEPLHNFTATYEKQSGEVRGSGVAYDKKDSEYLNLLKIDFLSLTTLTGVRATLEAIGMSISEYYQIPLDDPKVFELFRAGDMLGIFQFEGVATKRVLKDVAPEKFMDLVDVNALSRPGGDDAAYIKAKRSGVLPDLPEQAAQHLDWTYGTIVYQEQILLILRDMGNFEPAAVNSVRKAISAKKDATQFNVFREQFVDGAATHGISGETALGIWQLIVNASGYAFNISHAACYSDIAYRQGWLKVYHPEFYLGQLAKCPDDAEGLERRRKLIIEAERKGIKVNSVSLEHSLQNWHLHDGQLYAGFTAIKGIGPAIADNLVAWRTKVLEPQEPEADGMLFQADQALDWQDLLEVPGIGQGRVDTIRSFAESPDPFGVMKVKWTLDEIRDCFERGEFPGVPEPTHNSQQLTEPDTYVVFMGVLKKVIYKDTVAQRLKYGGEGTTRESILESLDQPHLLKYCNLDVEDEFDEPVRLRIGRKVYPRFKSLIDNATVGEDVVLVTGYVTDFGGWAIQVKELVIINPDN